MNEQNEKPRQLDLAQLNERLNQAIWNVDMGAPPWWRAALIRAARTAYAVGRDLTEGQLTLQAMSLVYTTLLSLVPLLAVSFSVLKGFGVHNQIEPMLLNLLSPLGEKGVEITRQVIGFVENMRVGVLGALGLGLLLYTVISLIQKVEHAFNYTWHVERSRPLSQRFSDYLSVILIGPVLVFSALGVTASVMSTSIVQRLVAIEPLGSLVELGARSVPYLFIIAAFTFVYIFVPNTRVRFHSALIGAVVAGVLWQSVGWLFAGFVVGSTKYTAIYSGFAIVILFMFWLYLAWLILLVGASIAFYHQHPEYLTTRCRNMHLSNRLRERLALLGMALIGHAHYAGRRPPSVRAMAERLGVPSQAMEEVLQPLAERGLLRASADESLTYLPARALETVSVKALLDVVRSAGEDPYLSLRRLPQQSVVQELVAEVDSALDRALSRRTLKDLALGETGPAPESGDHTPAPIPESETERATWSDDGNPSDPAGTHGGGDRITS
jgi:membrane protein